MRPWKIASETATLDNLSNGRTILSVGLGAVDTGFTQFGEATDIRERAALMDECLDIMQGLWAGQPFEYAGNHYQVKPTDFVPPPAPINGKVPIWMVGKLGSKKSKNRVLKYEGILPSVQAEDGGWRALTVQDIEEIRQFASVNNREDLEIIVEGETEKMSPDQAADEVTRWQAAGASWFIDAMWQTQFEDNVIDRVRARLEQGPPLT